jgi:PilZ domain-containing protein
MGLAEWLAAFRAQHDRAREGRLAARELAAYQASRDQLARALLAAQHMALRPGQLPRRSLRVARALQADLEGEGYEQRAVTVDFSSCGFAVLLGSAPGCCEEITCTLRLPGQEPVKGQAKVVDVKPLEGATRVAFAFQNLPGPERERLERLVFDTVLEQLAER